MSKLRVTMVRSVIGCTKVQRDTVRALGLKKIRQQVEHEDNPCIRGMIFRVKHLVEVEEV